MTDKVVDFQSRLAARKVEYAEYDKRMQHLGALFEMMDPVISKCGSWAPMRSNRPRT
jgi:hypothetical protein